MKIKPIPPQKFLHSALDYDPETGIFKRKWRDEIPYFENRRWAGKIAGTKGKKSIVISVDWEWYPAHRLAYVYMHGDVLSVEMQIDHKSNDPFDNRIANLRLATHGQNCTNCRARKGRLLPKGVYKYNESGMFRSAIGVNKKIIELGVFITTEEAHTAYMAAAKFYKGDFARSA